VSNFFFKFQNLKKIKPEFEFKFKIKIKIKN
jgi:hypothetical protein